MSSFTDMQNLPDAPCKYCKHKDKDEHFCNIITHKIVTKKILSCNSFLQVDDNERAKRDQIKKKNYVFKAKVSK